VIALQTIFNLRSDAVQMARFPSAPLIRSEHFRGPIGTTKVVP
jgi:hypothetical protein